MTLSSRSWLLVATPLLLAGLLVFHPSGDSELLYDDVRSHVTAWLVVHSGLAIGAVLMAVVLHTLLRDLTGRAANVARRAAVAFVASFLAWEGFTGIQTGVLTHEANGLPAGAQRDAAAANIQDHFTNPIIGDPSLMGMIANGSWIVAVVAAGLALRRAYGGRATLVLLCMASLFTAHAIILGPLGLACLAMAALIAERNRSRIAIGRSEVGARDRAADPPVRLRGLPRSAR